MSTYADQPVSLADRWRKDAGVLRRCGHRRTAELCEHHARELEDALTALQTEELSATQAAEQTGYSPGHLQDLARSGKVAASKVDGEWRFRRCDLPRKTPDRRSLSVVDEMAERLNQARRC